jgi:nitric oxide synthase-interacting protein
MKHFDACSLCLQPVIDPMCCLKGHLYCKECIYANILAQKKEIKRSKKFFEDQQQDQKDKDEQKRQQQKEEEIAAFGKVELGILPETHQVFKAKPEEGDAARRAIPLPTSSSTDLVVFSGPSGKNKDSNAIISNPADPAKEKLQLNSYWVPSLTPSAAPVLMKKPKTEVICIEGNHPIRLKKLVKVKFTLATDKSDPKHVQNNRYCCPVCRRTLTDAPKAIVLKSCGHVICLGCSEKFKNEKICNVCETPFKADHLILLQSGGTGFAGHDEKIIAKKEDVGAWV